jgi:hypothetical protein
VAAIYSFFFDLRGSVAGAALGAAAGFEPVSVFDSTGLEAPLAEEASFFAASL